MRIPLSWILTTLLMAGASTVPALAQKVSVPFLTTRAVDLSADGAVEYSNDVAELSAGQCEITLFKEGNDGGLSAINGVITAQATDDVLERFAGQAQPGILIYIHGYNISLRRACRDAARLARATGFDDRILLFSWPAGSAVVTYRRDERRLARSIPALLDAIDQVAVRHGHANINIVAHSMGSRVVVALGERPGTQALPQAAQFDDLILVAPDVDPEDFRSAAAGLRRRAKNISLVVSEDDKLLLLSELVNREQRLGLESDITIEGVEVLDVSAMDDLGLTGHIYHLENDRVGELLGRLLKSGSAD
jgi:esterase/lipase superfamily enzyme